MQPNPYYNQFTEEEQLEIELSKIRKAVKPAHSPYDVMPLAYISGKITGAVDGNKPKFQAAELLLLEKGYMTYNPHKLPDNHDKEWNSYMKVCCAHLTACDVVFAIDDWKKSRGAIREIWLAEWLKIPVYSIQTMSKVKISLWLKIKVCLNLI